MAETVWIDCLRGLSLDGKESKNIAIGEQVPLYVTAAMIEVGDMDGGCHQWG